MQGCPTAENVDAQKETMVVLAQAAEQMLTADGVDLSSTGVHARELCEHSAWFQPDADVTTCMHTHAQTHGLIIVFVAFGFSCIPCAFIILENHILCVLVLSHVYMHAPDAIMFAFMALFHVACLRSRITFWVTPLV